MGALSLSGVDGGRGRARSGRVRRCRSADAVERGGAMRHVRQAQANGRALGAGVGAGEQAGTAGRLTARASVHVGDVARST